MSDFASRDQSRDIGYAPRAPEADRAPAQTHVERAHEAVVLLARDVGAVAHALDVLRAEHDVADPTHWQDARASLDGNLAAARKALERARASAAGADAATQQQLADAEHALAAHERTAEELVGPPRAWKQISREDAIQALLDTPVQGPARDGFARKEAALLRELAQLSPADCRVLADRIRNARSGDPIAEKMAGFIGERRTRVLNFLDGARRRDAIQSAKAGAAREQPQKLPDAVRGDLEAATGRSLDHVRVHAGEHGRTTAAAHDARAVAIGGDIFMGEGQLDAESPEGRELLAHEVAHTVQAQTQPGPATPAAKRDAGSTEAAEVEADAFASQFRERGAGATWSPTVPVAGHAALRAPGPAAARHHALSPTTPIYVNTHRVRFLAAIRDRIAAVGIVQPHTRLQWSAQANAQLAIGAAIADYVDAASDVSLKRLMMLSYPADLFAIIDKARGEGGPAWHPNVGLAVALAMSEPIDAAIRQMGMRLRVQLDIDPAMPRPSALVASNPLDAVIAEVLVRPGMVHAIPKRRGGADDTPGKPFANGVFEVQYEWQGKYDRNLWNWIRVTSPKHATVEDVAHTPFVGDEVLDGSEQAYRIAASPPYFGIPFETARDVKEAVQHAPPEVQAQLATGPGPRVADSAPLEQSVVSDDAALAQAPAPSKSDLPAERALERSRVQLQFLERRLAPWNAAAPLAGATAFIERRAADLARDPKAAHRWQATLAAQERVLYPASSEAAEIVTQLEARAKPSEANAVKPAVRVLQAYARAAGVSHLAAEAQAALADARRQRALLSVAIAEDKIAAARTEAGFLRDAQGETGKTAQGASATAAEIPDLDRRAADLRLRFSRGEAHDPDTVDQLAVDADEVALRERILTIQTQVQAIVDRADAAGLDRHPFSGGLPTVHALADVLLGKKVPEWIDTLDRAKHWQGPMKGLSNAQTMTRQMRTAVDGVAQDIVGFDRKADVGAWLSWARGKVAQEELRNRIDALAFQLGIMIATGEIAGAALTALRGAALGAELISDVRGAGLAYKAAEIGVHAGLATAAQGATGGEFSGRAFAENAIGIAATGAAMEPFQGLLHDSDAVEQEVARSFGELAKRSAKAAAEMAIETGAGVAGSAIAHAATHPGDAQTVGTDDVITQGIALAASRFVGQRMRGMHERIEKAARELGPAAFDRLLARVDALANRAAATRRPSIPEARAFLVERRTLLDEERRLYQAHLSASDPVEARSAASATKLLDADLAASPITATLRLSGLTPVVNGQIYEGTPKQIRDAITAAKASGPEVQHVQRGSVHEISQGGRTIEIREIGGTGAPLQSTTVPDGARPDHATATKPGRHEGTNSEEKRTAHPDAADATEQQRTPKPGRITKPVDGLYASIDPSHAPQGWNFHDSLQRGGSLYTEVTAPNGATGHVWRSYDPSTQQWVMLEAFFDANMPTWIETGTEMVPGKGTPLIAYLDMRLMREYQVAFSSLKSTKLSTIQNVEAVCQLEAQLRKGVDVNDAVRNTHSVSYAETELVQSGHQIAGVKLVGGRKTEINVMLTHYERSGFRTAAQHDAILKKYGISRTDIVLWDYDIYIDLVPFPAQGTP